MQGLALEGLAARYVKLRRDGPAWVLYEAGDSNGEPLRLAARVVKPAKGRKLAAELNGRLPRGGAPRAAYSAELGLLIQVFPADLRLEHLPTAVDPSAIASVLTAVLAGRFPDARFSATPSRRDVPCAQAPPRRHCPSS